MKLILLCVLAIVGLSNCDTAVHPRGCIYALGKCIRECEVGTRAYAIGCGFKTPEATCKEPNPQKDESGFLCDYSACYCEPPTVRDEASGKCVTLDKCLTPE